VILTVEIEHTYRAGGGISVAFQAQTPGVTALFGPSGAGKTTILNAMAGLLRPKHIRVELDGLALHKIPAARRRIGYVFQDGRLFPHLTVLRNLQYGVTRSKPGPIKRDDVIGLLGLEPLLPRRPHTLSGGERQRVAIGRALLSQPRLLLMDEPLSALDHARRDDILPYLARLRTAFYLPIIYASHALDEVMRLADTLVLIEAGRQVAAGPLTELVSRVDLPLAARDDAAGVLRGKIYSHAPERRLTAVACGGNILWVPQVNAVEGTDLRLRVAAREVMLALREPRGISVTNILGAQVAAVAVDDAGHAALVEMDLDGGGQIIARITLDAAQRLDMKPGAKVLALIKAVSVELAPE
jgi:molybdate transport system ATP-binding protein